MCLRSVHSFQPIIFQELHSFLSSHPYISFSFHFMHSPQHRTASVVSFLSIPQAPLIQSVTTQALFPSHFQPYVLFSAASKPQWNESFWFWLGMVSFSKRIPKDKYNKDFLSIIFTDKKIKNLAKIRRPTQTKALGSKGRCTSCFEKKSPHFRKLQVVFFPKTLTAQSVRLMWKLYFSFFSTSFFSSLFWG